MAEYKAADNRYESMKYCYCGNSGLKLSKLSLGLWHNFGINGVYENMKQICFTAFDHGITQFDLANNYGPDPGDAERNFGKILRLELKAYRDEFVITTKAGYDMWKGPYGSGGSRKHLMASIDQSLTRMGIDYVDIFYSHRMDPEVSLEETAEALADIVRRGKALYAGISNYDKENTRKIYELLKEKHCPCIVNQRRYSIFDRTIEEDGVKEYAKENGIGIVAFSPLAQGLLSDKYLHEIPADSRIARDPRFLTKSNLTKHRLRQISELNQLAGERGQTLPEMALAWVIRDGVTSALIGVSKPTQIIENVRCLNHSAFSDDELKKIDEITFSAEE